MQIQTTITFYSNVRLSPIIYRDTRNWKQKLWENSNDNNFWLGFPIVELLFQEFKDIFPKEIPHGLPPSRGTEHQIDLLLEASLPNRPAYKSNPQETEEIKKQVQDLMQKRWVQESLSPCAVPVILVPKKDGTWRTRGKEAGNCVDTDEEESNPSYHAHAP